LSGYDINILIDIGRADLRRLAREVVPAFLMVSILLISNVGVIDAAAVKTVCPGDMIVTGTPIGQSLLRQNAGRLPSAMTRSAAIIAAIRNPQQRDRVAGATQISLRQNGFSDDEVQNIFPLLYHDASHGRNMAEATRTILGGVAGAVLGMAGGGTSEGVLGGGAAGAAGVKNLQKKRTIDIASSQDIMDIINIIIPDPCRMTADQAIEQLAR
jgi:hypothetical protein